MAYRKRGNEIGITIICGILTAGLIGLTGFIGLENKQKSEQLKVAEKEVEALEISKEKLEEQFKEIELQNTQLASQIEALQKDLNQLEKEGFEIEPIEEESQKYAYLTFDDGPSKNTLKILDFLKANNINATFFVAKKEGYDDVYQRIVNEGHTLALHTDTHDYSKIYQSVDTYFEDLNSISDHVKEITGVESKILRFPGGSTNTVSIRHGHEGLMDEIIEAVTEEGYVYFDWNVDSSDASRALQDKDVIVDAVLTQAKWVKEANILMHDAAGKTTTVDALPEIVEGLKAQGFLFKPITEDTRQIAFGRK